MLYLAKLKTTDVTSNVSLVLLVCQTSENDWSLVPSSAEKLVEVALAEFLLAEDRSLVEDIVPDGFVLAEVSESGQVRSAQNATPWVLMLIEQYLSKKLTPDLLMMESKRAEEWRQFLTLQNQDVVRRSLEVETRREQIQELERGLEDKRTKLEMMQEDLATEQAALVRKQKKLDADLQAFYRQQHEWGQQKELLLKELVELENSKRQLIEDLPD